MDAWKKINEATTLHAWKPLLDTDKTGEAVAGGMRQCEATTLTTVVEVDQSVPAHGFLHVEEKDVKVLIGKHPEEQTIEDMLQDDDEQLQVHQKRKLCSQVNLQCSS